MNLIRQFAVVARDIRQRAETLARDDLRRKLQIANRDDFFLRVTREGYDWGKDPDPDNLLPGRYPK